MNAVVIFNGLGNQMSQYAFYLAKRHYDPKCKVFFDLRSKKNHNGFELERIFGIKFKKSLTLSVIQQAYRLFSIRGVRHLLRFIGIKKVIEPITYDYNKENLESKSYGLTYYWGGWHSEKYFSQIAYEIRTTFTFPEVLDSKEYSNILSQINADEYSVSMHIRRGDFLKEPPHSPYQYYYCDENYYLNAIKYILSRYEKAHFYVFSDDMDWCKSFLPSDKVTFIDFNRGKDSWRDMCLMSKCRHHINANSTFSWWGAWLSPHKGIVIRPPKFLSNHETKDFYPDNWIVINSNQNSLF